MNSIVVVLLSSCCDSAQIPRTLSQASLGIPQGIDGLNQSDGGRWQEYARVSIQADERARENCYQQRTLEAVWQIPKSDELPEGGVLLDGICIEDGVPESERRDLRVVVLECGHSSLPITIVNGGPRMAAAYRLSGNDTALLLLTGCNWRSASSLHIIAINSRSGDARLLLDIGGEEEADDLSYEVRQSPEPEIVVLGVRESKREGISKRLQAATSVSGIKFRLR